MNVKHAGGVRLPDPTARVWPPSHGSAPPALGSSPTDLATDEANRHAEPEVELATALCKVMRAAEQLVGTEMGSVYLFEPQTGELVLRAWDGISDASATVLGRRQIGQHLVGHVAQLGQPVASYDLANDSRCIRDVVQRERMQAALLVPFYSQVSLAGVLVVQTRSHRDFTDRDVAVLSTLGSQATIAIESARWREHERAALAALGRLYEETSAQRDYLRSLVTAQDQFLQLAAAGGGLASLAQKLAELTANAVIVQNQFLQIIAAAGCHAGNPRDESYWSRLSLGMGQHVAAHSLSSTMAYASRPIRLGSAGQGDVSRIVAPIVAENNVLGYLSVIEQTHALGESDDVMIEQVATIMALELVRQRTALGVEMRLRVDFLDDLFTVGLGSESAIVTRAAYLGCNLRRPHRVVVFAIDDVPTAGRENGDEECQAISLHRHLGELIETVAARHSPGSLVAARGLSVVLLTPATSGAGATANLIDQLRARVAELIPGATLSAGVGSECVEPADLRVSYEEARGAVALLKNSDRKNETAWSERLRLHGLLFRGGDQSELARFSDRVLGRLIAYDRKHRTQLVPTLDCYLRNSQNLRRSAEALHIHVNTLEYRLRRIMEISGINLNDPDERLDAEVALRIVRCPSS